MYGPPGADPHLPITLLGVEVVNEAAIELGDTHATVGCAVKLGVTTYATERIPLSLIPLLPATALSVPDFSVIAPEYVVPTVQLPPPSVAGVTFAS